MISPCLLLGLALAGAGERELPRIERLNGVPTMVADGSPLLILGAQCDIWRSPRPDARTVAFFDGFRDMHATVVGIGIPWSNVEPAARRKYAEALYPLKNAMAPIADARGTERLAGWYALREFRAGTGKGTGFFVRQGLATRMTSGDRFDVQLGGLWFEISDTAAGAIVARKPGELCRRHRPRSPPYPGREQSCGRGGYVRA